jgi:hypothetical protein
VESIKNLTDKVGGWVKTNVTGEGEKTSTDYIPVDKRAKDIKDRFDHIDKEVARIDKEISEIAQASKIRPPSLSNVSDKNLVIIGAASGAAIGGGIKMVDGVLNVAMDHPSVEVTKTTNEITRPILKGFEHHRAETKDSHGYLQGYEHSFTPRIEYEKVGKYTVPDGKVIHTADVGNPIVEGAKGLAIGGVVGGVIGVGVAVGRKILKKGQYEPQEERKLEGEGKVIAVGAGAGAAGGAILGAMGAMSESGNAVNETLKWKQPIMEKTTLGQIPQDTHQSIYDVYKEANLPRRDVLADGPKMEKGLLGIGGEKPVMQEMEKTISSGARFGMLGQVLGGMVLGAIGGALSGIVLNVLRKIL